MAPPSTMLARAISTAAILAAHCVLAALAPAQQGLQFDRIWEVQDERWVQLVHVEAVQPEIRLGVYSRREQVAVWPPRPTGEPPGLIKLAEDERFVHSINREILGIVKYQFNCVDAIHPGLTLFTELRFPKDFPLPDPPFPLLPTQPPNPPPPIEGTWQVHLDGGGELLLLTRAGASDRTPTEVKVFVVVEEGGVREFTEVGQYTNNGQGGVQTSRLAPIIAQAERREIRLIDHGGNELARVPGGSAFFLSASGRRLAVCEGRAVVFHALGAQGTPTESTRVEVPSLPLGVVFAGPRALIRARENLLLVDPANGAVLWTKTAAAGIYTSAHMARLDPDGLVIASGRLEVLRPAARVNGKHARGLARAHVELFAEDGRALVIAHVFETGRWTGSSPRVRLLRSARRVVVDTRDLVLLSDPLP